MAELAGKRFESPDEIREFTDGGGRVAVVDLNATRSALVRSNRVGAGLRMSNPSPEPIRARSSTSATSSRAAWR